MKLISLAFLSVPVLPVVIKNIADKLVIAHLFIGYALIFGFLMMYCIIQ